MHKKAIIFDFDGTLANTIPYIYEVANELAEKHGFQRVSQDQFNQLRNKSPFEIIDELQIPLLKIPFILNEGRKLLKKHIINVLYIEGMQDVLVELKKQGLIIGILTSNSRQNIDVFLKHNPSITFDFIYTERNIFGKQFSLRNIIKKEKLNLAETIYVGDEVRDVESCHALELDVIAVTWGFGTKESLKKYKPTFIVNKPREMLSILLSS